MTTGTTVRGERAGPGRRAAYAACVLALLYAAVSFYWAAGGTAGLSTIGGELEEMGYEGSYDAVADHLRCLRKDLSPPARAPTTNGGKTQGARHESQETARLLMLEARDPEAVHPEQRRWLEGLRVRCPELAAVQEMAGRFARIMRDGEEGGLGS